MTKLLNAAAILAFLLTGAWVVVDLWADWRLDRAEERFEESVGPLDPDAYVPTPADPESPAGARLMEALRLYRIDQEDDRRLGELGRRPPAEWTDAERGLVARLAEEHAESLALVRTAAAGLQEAPFPDLVAVTSEASGDGASLVRLLLVSKLLLAHAGLALAGSPAETAADLAALGNLADAVGRQPELVYPLVGWAIENLFLHGARWVAADPTTPPEVTAAVLDALPRTPAGERFSVALAHTAAQSAASIERQEIPLEGLERLAPWLRSLAQVSALDAFRRMAEASDDPLTLARTGEQMRQERSLGSIVTSLLIPNLMDALYKARALDASRDVARLALELRLHRDLGASGGGPSELVSGRPPRVEVTQREDGSVLLRDPGARAAWEERWGDQPHARQPPYEWLLPASVG